MERNRKPQYRTLVKALTSLNNAVHDELENVGGIEDLGERRRRLRRLMNRADDLIVRADTAMAQKAAKKESTNVNSSS